MSRDKTTDSGSELAIVADDARQQAKADFGRRLHKSMIKKGWRQSDLARHSEIGKDSISNYVNGRTVPTRQNIERLAQVLALAPNDLWPGYDGSMEGRRNVLTFRVDPEDPGYAFVVIDSRLPVDLALKLLSLAKDQNSVAHAS
ncbi:MULTISPECIES: helix-turn-helix transcriptional regulator [unclassified Mesorhizobium]|uniref:helix-turn-helix domain-containing protein n=1 Tax=unclassified Mesorhizobium TaxID=325217 RepID=UPI000FD9D470|nr:MULTISPECIES: helix-turn-helix transcriptional regulator [unclassified Mesorhizobium]RWA81458.1 MAG: XRE family transcriptional regulator [Mesorhizobium sp.]TGT76202.1 XRE family transcriptional regulator [Mesorhizobium sp. M2E.F.Ca.ET.166.01.1.1]TGW02317.1 XRE family transcriptional regulator [Mesorhizobium sp. M2E.F.Ca.ET.154.01.1.1]